MMGWLQAVLATAGCLFFLIGTIALLRFPDPFTRIHALTKADNLGFGLITLALLPSADSVAGAFKLVLIWLLVLLASATAAHLMARASDRRRVPLQPASGAALP